MSENKEPELTPKDMEAILWQIALIIAVIFICVLAKCEADENGGSETPAARAQAQID